MLFTLALVGWLALAGPDRPCTVARVVDGDTFYCSDGLKVRLIGIDAPERGQGQVALESTAALRRLLPLGARIRLEQDVGPRDRYGRTLAYAWAGDSLVNETLVRDGWAFLLTVPPNVKYVKRLERAQNAARTARAGLWREPGLACAPREWRNKRC
ncbi:MAG TPA: thermonuclease family protein [Gemmatimonadales bacterium]|jgi:micrococcal nuclease|nr:thermonuclease family protein [Gemmatimonadales bacterium]